MLDDQDDYRVFHPGFLVVACRSYEQAHRKCAEFNERKGPEKGFRGVVLRSFDEVFRDLVPGFRSSAERAARNGYSSEIEAVYADPSCAQLKVINRHRHQLQYELGWRGGNLDRAVRDSTVIFTTHGLVQNWFHPGGTRYWLHPGLRNRCRRETISTTRQNNLSVARSGSKHNSLGFFMMSAASPTC